MPEPVPNGLLDEMSSLFSAFLPPDVADRFSTLLRYKPNRWSKIDPWRVWHYCGTGGISEWKGSGQELLASPLFAPYASAEATVLRCGHETPGIGRLAIQEALIGRLRIFEGFISVVPGRLGIAANHDGLSCVLHR